MKATEDLICYGFFLLLCAYFVASRVPESTDEESGIHRHGIWNQQCGFRNPRLTLG